MNNDKKIAAREEAVEKTRSPLGIRIAKYVTAFAVVLVLFWFGCTCEVREGETAVILRFGAVREEITDAGLYFKLPWPFETSVTYDGRVQYLETGDLETMTKDKRNIVVRSFVTWEVADPVLYHNSVGFNSTAEQKLNSQVFNATNSTLGTYNLTNLVSLDQEEIKIDQIQNEIYAAVREVCLENYGIRVTDVSFLLFSLPDATLESVFEQMQAERQKEIDIILANAYLKANDITTEADAEASKIRGEGTTEAAKIRAEAEKAVTEIYNNAYNANIDLYQFLRNLDTLVSSVNSSSVLVVNINKYPFNILLDYSDYMTDEDGDKVIHDLTYILSQLDDTQRQAIIDGVNELIEEAAAKNGITMPEG